MKKAVLCIVPVKRVNKINSLTITPQSSQLLSNLSGEPLSLYLYAEMHWTVQEF